MSLPGIEGKVALVTGAAQGIGAAVAQVLAEQGAVIAAVDRDAEGVGHLVRELQDKGCRRSRAYSADVSNLAAIEEIVDAIERDTGPIEILVNVAGVLRMGAIATLNEDDWRATFDVNTNGVFFVSRTVARRMIPRQSGAIVTVSSNASGVPRMKMAAYAASKAASTMFTKCLGLELSQYHIRCNIVSPGSTDTAMQRLLRKDDSGPSMVIMGSQADYRLGIPLQKIASPRDIAEAAAFLVSDNASHITMHDLCVDGGATLGI
ncbi:2,3-dihydro-2,3-dihydroxybenzoate dehydrogenase [Paenibacillus cellulosilyticus]|uniref:2,3-dihydro-2,3-dihydroxybenzoate dehydrogenase n=1 Tax=Paenibacillus cellulosilyticus TaxID=375489 RepID=A0A2V2YKN5_9BACL|nr:2,3-dihydro-2,3-dihydroxybenzoate dehydrogenase [Paenibacillus cellulosilyticus]PWV93787.1 2,3-dihydro-2,3-dihydroxybenzoate dehydrogenase [Paenibacillus cellulosilyticus]QKS47405.1 2,3-dihydro-2,3-dihydroxybenzoate dehydrogenase [Paenibacillus cellulosilyticus]